MIHLAVEGGSGVTRGFRQPLCLPLLMKIDEWGRKEMVEGDLLRQQQGCGFAEGGFLGGGNEW